MARLRRKKSPRKSTLWQAAPDDAIRLAALRWFAVKLEALSIEIYASDKSRFEDLENVLRLAMRRVKDIRKTLNLTDPEDCPDGYFLCKDGLCAPMCDHVPMPADE